jgi:CW-type Zinc Finger
MSSLRLALKQSLEETGHLIKDKKKKPAKRSSKSSNKKRPHQQPGELPRKRGRPRKHPGGEDAHEDQVDVDDEVDDEDDGGGAGVGGVGGVTQDHQSGSEDEGSGSENEFSFESEEEVDDSDEGDDEEEDDEGPEKQDDENESQRHHGDEAAERNGTTRDAADDTLPATVSTGPASPDDADVYSEEERRRQKKLFKKHLQQAANKIQAQWKKKAGLATGGDSVNEREIPGESDPPGGQSPMCNRDAPSNSNNSTPSNMGVDTKKTKASKSQTVPPPEPEVLEWNRALSEKKCKKHIATGMRVKVCFAAKVKREGKVFKKKIWYGGRVSAVSKEGSKIRIKYDDGTSEISKFPDKDVVVDDAGNGEHRVSAHKFIPPPPREQIEVGNEDDEPATEIEDERNAAMRDDATAEIPVSKEKLPSSTESFETSSEGGTMETTEATHLEPKEAVVVESHAAPETTTADGEENASGNDNGEITSPPPKLTQSTIASATNAAGQGEIFRNFGSPEEGELSPGLSLGVREKAAQIDLEVTSSTSADEAGPSLDDVATVQANKETEESDRPMEPVQNVSDESKDAILSKGRGGVLPNTPKLTIRISNVAASKVPKPADSDSEEELSADTPVTERKAKSIQLRRKAKRKRDVEGSVDDQPTNKKIGLKRNENHHTSLEMPEAYEASSGKIVTTSKPSVALSVLVDTPQLEEKQLFDAPTVRMPKHDPDEIPLLPRLEKKKERSKSPVPKGDMSPVPSRSATPFQNNADTAPAVEERIIPASFALAPEGSQEDFRSSSPIPEESESGSLLQSKGSLESLSAARSGRKAAQQAKEKLTPKQDEKLEKKKKKRKLKEGEGDGELSDASVDDRQWVQCDSCSKWRILPSDVKTSSLPKHWYCHLNIYDPKRNNCAAPEQTAKQAAKEWRKARKRAKIQRLAELQELEMPYMEIQGSEKEEPAGSSSPKAGKGKKIKRMSPVCSEEPLSGPDAPKTEKKSKKGKPPPEVSEPLPAPDMEAPKKPGRKRGRPARSQTPQKENDGHDNVEWVQCEKCEKWRKLPPHVSADELPDTWYCKMNTWNPDSASCNAPEDKADATHHEVGTFAGMFGAGAGKNSYRALIFGTGKKLSRPMSERARAAESLFMRPVDDAENPCPSVMYSSSSCFMPRTSNFNKSSTIEEEKPPSLFEVLSNSDIFAELRGIGQPMQVTSIGAAQSSLKRPMFINTPENVKQIMSEIVLRSLGDRILTGDELILTMHGFHWESLSVDFAVVRPYFNADIIINTLLALVRDGVVEMTSFRDRRIPIGQWTPRYRKVRSLRAMKIEEAIKASRCMKIAKPWKQRGSDEASEWVTGSSPLP